MFESAKAFSGFSVDDIAAAKAFYAGTLGLKVTEENGMLTLHIEGGSQILVYPKENHAPATFTILNFPVGDVDEAVDDLAARGVSTLRYDGFPQDGKGVMRGHGPAIAWFADPAGNVLAVLEQS